MSKSFLRTAAVLALAFVGSSARADDCAVLKQAMIKGLKQESWHTVNRVDNAGTQFAMELIRAGDQVYMRNDGGAWVKTPMTPDMVIKQNQEMVSGGMLKLSACKKTGSDTLPQGKADRYEYVSESPGTPAITAKLWIGSSDGLPYKSASPTTESTTTYTGVSAPK